MLVIRDEQMAVLNQFAERRFEEKMMKFLRQQFREAKPMSPEELRPVVRTQIAQARSYELLTEQHIATYVTTAWLISWHFDMEFPEVQGRLKSAEYEAQEKSEWLVEWATERMSRSHGNR